MVMLASPGSSSAVEAEENDTLKVTTKQLKRAASNSHWRLKKAIEKDGFYSARVALNVWRSNAIDAGLFDQSQYDEFKRQIYEKSVISNLNCFEMTIINENYTDARICLHTWKIHSEVLGTFDQAFYDEMKNRLKTAIDLKKE
jgi:hypothetical protein